MQADEDKVVVRRFVQTVRYGHSTSAVGDLQPTPFTFNDLAITLRLPARRARLNSSQRGLPHIVRQPFTEDSRLV
jgi:hypothetical protein